MMECKVCELAVFPYLNLISRMTLGHSLLELSREYDIELSEIYYHRDHEKAGYVFRNDLTV